MRILRYRATYREDGGVPDLDEWHRAQRARRLLPHPQPGAAAVRRGAGESRRAPGPDRLAEHERDTARLRRALQLLREDKRELIVLARYRDMKYEAIAELLGVDVGTVKVRVHRAVK